MEFNNTLTTGQNDSVSNFAENALKRVIYSDQAVNTALVFCIIFVVLGVLGNICTIAAILNSRKLRHAPTSVFVVSLSVADLIFCVFNLPLTAVRYYHQKWVLGETLCKLFAFFFYLNVAASLFNMVAVTLNRYVMIAHYHRYDRMYRRTTIAVMIAFCWAVPVAMLLPTLAEAWGRFGYYESTFSCTILKHNGLSPKKFLFIVGFFFPCTIIIVSYLRIFCVVRSSRRNLNGYEKKSTISTPPENGISPPVISPEKTPKKSSSASGGHQIDEMALTYTILAIFCAFILCYLPLMIANVFDDNEKFPMIHVLASVLAWASAVVNPFVYGLMSKRYREAYANLCKFLPCPWCRKVGRWSPNGSSNETTHSSATRHEIMETSVVYSVNGNGVSSP